MDPLSKLMQRYCFAYTATHDFSVAEKLMADDYVFHMGQHTFRGREDSYRPAAERQFQAYPGLGFTVHEFISNGERCAVYFTEHGRSVQYAAEAAWHGLSLYRWNGRVLTECRVEQDYYSRRRQLNLKVADPIDPPACAPWLAAPDPPNAEAEGLAAAWLKANGLLRSRIGSLDDERISPSIDRVMLDAPETHIIDLFSSGQRVAWSVRIDGEYAGGLGQLDRFVGAETSLYVNGIVHFEEGAVARVRAVTDRYTMERRIRATAEAAAFLG